MNNRIRLFKKAIGVFLAFAIMVSITGISTLQAHAYATWGKNQMTGGVGKSGNYTRCYWYDTSSLNTTWQTRIIDSMYDWCHTGSKGCGTYTSVWFTRSNVKSNSVIDFYASSNLPYGTYGMTSFYTGTGSNSVIVYPYSSTVNWIWAKIEINTSYSDGGTLTIAQKKAMVEHEIGHAFGLAHIYATNKLMHPYGNECTATKPTTDECNGVNYLYGGYNP